MLYTPQTRVDSSQVVRDRDHLVDGVSAFGPETDVNQTESSSHAEAGLRANPRSDPRSDPRANPRSDPRSDPRSTSRSIPIQVSPRAKFIDGGRIGGKSSKTIYIFLKAVPSF